MEFVARTADRVVVMAEGEIVADGPAADVVVSCPRRLRTTAIPITPRAGVVIALASFVGLVAFWTRTLHRLPAGLPFTGPWRRYIAFAAGKPQEWLARRFGPAGHMR
ncbi:hypothetical protein [Streptomyces sp. NPDC020607]|uniref:hypothetical protein n=1 Tax=Streptomyces sp. NPDC020607 TaxID=3365082 RepID=UPI0037ADE280